MDSRSKGLGGPVSASGYKPGNDVFSQHVSAETFLPQFLAASEAAEAYDANTVSPFAQCSAPLGQARSDHIV